MCPYSRFARVPCHACHACIRGDARGLGPIVISDRLVVRPPFSAWTCLPGQREIVIDPGQAFGTGTHASTHLCLEWIDALLAESDGPARFARMLDVGTGSGVLALAAVARGVREAVGFDLDPVAIEAAEDAARRNGLEAAVRFVCVPIEAIDGGAGFDVLRLSAGNDFLDLSGIAVMGSRKSEPAEVRIP